MAYRITRADGGKDHITLKDFENYDDADYEDRPYYEIVKLKA